MWPQARIKVVKRDGREEEYMPEKIVVSCLKSGASLEASREIALIVTARLLEAGKERVTAKELTRDILTELKKRNEEWYRNWIVFDRAVKKRRTEKELEQ